MQEIVSMLRGFRFLQIVRQIFTLHEALGSTITEIVESVRLEVSYLKIFPSWCSHDFEVAK
jgi:hypothetical protein